MSGKFKKATRSRSRLRMGLCGPSSAGKTYTALRLAFALAEARGRDANRPGRVGVIDSENGSASKYVGERPDGFPWDFDVLELSSFSPSEYTAALEEAARAGFDVIIIDSLSHAWEGKDGALDLVDKKKSANSFTAWKDVTPLHRRMIEAVLTSPCDVICTLRAKTEYVLEANDKGKLEPRKIGMAPIQRQGMEYEFDVFADMDQTHILTVTKTRCAALDGVVCARPGPGFIAPVISWLTTGEATPIGQASVRMGGTQDERAGLVEKILAEAVRIGWDRQHLDTEVKAKYGVESLDGVTTSDLGELARRLAKLPAKRAATTPPAVREPIVEEMDVPLRKVSTQQLARIKDLRAQLFALINGDEGVKTARWKGQLAKYGVDSARDLSHELAVLMIRSLENEIQLMNEGGDPFTNGAAPAATTAAATPTSVEPATPG